MSSIGLVFFGIALARHGCGEGKPLAELTTDRALALNLALPARFTSFV